MSAASEPAKRPRPWLVPLVVVVLAAIGVGVGVAIAASEDDGDDRSGSSYAAQLANVQSACQEWMDSADAADRPSGDWCAAMAGWMNQQVAGGHMMGRMMWGDPDRMAAACRQWASANAAGSDPQWCDDMVTWMRDHMRGDWDDWMMDGPMMGR